MDKNLDVIDTDIFSNDEKTEIANGIDALIARHRANRQEINRLVFESVAVMTEGDDAEAQLSSKGFFARLLGGITGSNQKLQNKINKSRAAAQYAAQQTLQRLAEQNLMTFDLITAVNNKLNASMNSVSEEFRHIYSGLAKFLRQNKSEMAQMELRVSRLEKNVRLLTWENSIEYRDLNGTPYTELSAPAKIACIVRDFYDMTGGEWTTSELLLLKTAMATVGIEPSSDVNYYEVLRAIASDEALRAKLLGGSSVRAIDDPSYLIAMGVMKKLDTLEADEAYITDGVMELTGEKERARVLDVLIGKYLERTAGVRVDVNMKSYDLVLELLYNISEATAEHIITGGDENDDAPQNDAQAGSDDNTSVVKRFIITDDGAINMNEIDLKFVKDAIEKKENLDEAFEKCRYLAEHDGYVPSFVVLGKMYGNGLGTDKDDEKAFQWYKKGAEAGDAEAMYRTGACYYSGYGVAEDEDEAVKWCKKGAENGNADAMNMLGGFYELGAGVEPDMDEAVYWYKKGAELGCVEAMSNLGSCYYFGNGFEKDAEKAAYWNGRAADGGDTDAMWHLAIQYGLGDGVEQDDAKAIELLERASELGDAEAMNILGGFYYEGICTEIDYGKAVYCLKRAADNGNVEAMDRIGVCYYYGFGVKEDDERAVYWFKRAADNSNANAMNHLGCCYWYGNGVEASVKTANKYFADAAQLGSEEAKKNLRSAPSYNRRVNFK